MSRPSLKTLPPEVLVHVFARLSDIHCKINLQRVNRKFRDCIRLPEAWQFDTTLRLEEFNVDSLAAFLKRAVVITRLDISHKDNGTVFFGIFPFEMNGKFLRPLWAFSEKLQIEHLICNNACRQRGKGIEFMMGYVFGRFQNSLRTFEFTCSCELSRFRTDENELHCATQEDLFNSFLAPCKGLEHISLRSIHLQEYIVVLGGDQHRRRLPVLAGKPLKRLELDVRSGNLELERRRQLIGVLNSPTSRIHTLSLTSKFNFYLTSFCRDLQPHAAESLKSLTLKMTSLDYVKALPSLPTLLPALKFVQLYINKPAQTDPLDVAEALGGFLHAGRQRTEPIELKLHLISRERNSAEFMAKLWKVVNALMVVRSGTRRGNNLGERWSRVLNDGNATATIFAQNPEIQQIVD